jgi:hypothetical protein
MAPLVDAEFGIDPEQARRNDPGFDDVASKSKLRRWLQSSLDGLADAAVFREPNIASTLPPGAPSKSPSGRVGDAD